MQRRTFLAAAASAAVTGLAAAPPPARAQSSTVRLLVGATPGGGTDIVARTLATELSKRLGRQFAVDNRPGAAGNIAAQACAQAAPDGNTLLLSYTSHAINATLYPKLPFDPVKDFTTLGQVARLPAFLVANPGLEAKDMRELIALAKARPGKLNIAIAGIGGANHIGGEMLKMDAGIDIVSIAYKGTGPAMTDVMGGQVDLTFAGIASGQSLVKAGKLKALGVTSEKRLDAFPGVAAIAETIPGYAWNSWYGLFGPAGMDPALVETISRAARDSLDSPQMQERFATEGIIGVGSSPTEFRAFLVDEIARFGKVIRAANLSPQ